MYAAWLSVMAGAVASCRSGAGRLAFAATVATSAKGCTVLRCSVRLWYIVLYWCGEAISLPPEKNAGPARTVQYLRPDKETKTDIACSAITRRYYPAGYPVISPSPDRSELTRILPSSDNSTSRVLTGRQQTAPSTASLLTTAQSIALYDGTLCPSRVLQ